MVRIDTKIWLIQETVYPEDRARAKPGWTGLVSGAGAVGGKSLARVVAFPVAALRTTRLGAEKDRQAPPF